MVLLRGLNYDYSGQQSSKINTAASAAATTLVVENTEGFSDDDYLLINPGNEQSEIVRINDTVSSDTSLTVTALKFAHAVGEKVFRMPFNQMKFYECSTEDGNLLEIWDGHIYRLTFSLTKKLQNKGFNFQFHQ